MNVGSRVTIWFFKMKDRELVSNFNSENDNISVRVLVRAPKNFSLPKIILQSQRYYFFVEYSISRQKLQISEFQIGNLAWLYVLVRAPNNFFSKIRFLKWRKCLKNSIRSLSQGFSSESHQLHYRKSDFWIWLSFIAQKEFHLNWWCSRPKMCKNYFYQLQVRQFFRNDVKSRLMKSTKSRRISIPRETWHPKTSTQPANSGSSLS